MAFLFANCHTDKSKDFLNDIQTGEKDLNIILISIDTLRADRLSPYGYDIETPNIEKLASEGTIFMEARTPVPLTLPAHSAMLTGINPPGLGVHDNGQFLVDDGILTLAEILKKNNYKTSAFIGGLPLAYMFGLGQGFDYYWDEEVRKTIDNSGNIKTVRAEEVVENSMKWIERNSSGKFFTFIHIFDPHTPYEPPTPFNKTYKNNLYDGEIAYVDKCLGKIFQWAEENRYEKPTLIIFTADHGEAFGEHNEIEHGWFIYEPTMHIPMIFWAPSFIPQNNTIKNVVSLIDIFPTVLSILGIQTNTSVEGENLLPLIYGDDDYLKDRALYYESFQAYYGFGYSKLFGLEKSGWKYISAPEPELYNLKKDPDELKNIYKNHPDIISDMDEILSEKFTDSLNSKPRIKEDSKIDPKTEVALMGLGYISSGDLDGQNENIDPKDKIEFYTRLRKIWLSVFYGQGDYNEEDLKAILETSPDEPNIVFSLGKLYMKKGDNENGIEYFEKALKLAPERADFKIALSRAYSDINQPEKALTLLKDITDNPQYADISTLRDAYLGSGIILYQNMNSPKEAVKYLKKSIELDENYADPYYLLTIIAFKEFLNYEMTVDYGTKFLNLEPSGEKADHIRKIIETIGY
jgi:arylsulfatase A-like enzyme